MHKGNGLRKYLYEYLVYKAVERAREQTSEVVPISQAKSIRRHVDAILAEQNGRHLGDPELGMNQAVAAIDQALVEKVPGYTPVAGDHRAPQDEFVTMVGMHPSVKTSAPRLAISPYDPEWSERATVKRGGTALSFVPDEAIVKATGGSVAALSDPDQGNVMLWRVDENGKASEVGRAMTHEDASGLSALMDKMSEREYAAVRNWVIDGGKNPATGRIDRNRFMSQRAIARSAAVLDELKAQGVSYSISRDREIGQIKASIAGTGMEIRLTDTREEEYAGARIYDNGMVTRFSTNHRQGENGRMAVYDPSPEDAVALLRFAQGQEVDRRDMPGTAVGVVEGTHREGNRSVPDSYNLGREAMFTLGDYVAPGEAGPRDGSKVLLRREGGSRTRAMFFVDAERAEQYASEAVETARQNLQDALGVEQLIQHAQEVMERTEGSPEQADQPEFSSDAEIASIQRAYWEVLTEKRAHLLHPGATEEMYREKLDAIGEMGADEQPDLGNLAYGGEPAEKVRRHAEDVTFELIGTWEPETHLVDGEWVDKRFDAGRVARWMTSSTGQWSNLDNLASALRTCQVDPAEMIGTDFQALRFKDRLVRFDTEHSVAIAEHDSPFLREIGETVRSSIERAGSRAGDIQIDENGVISWKAERVTRSGKTEPIAGEIGQVFDPGQHGEIITRFASGENALVVPGYEARIAAQVPGEAPRSVEERTVLRGYEQLMHERIAYQLSGDLVSGRSRVGEPASVNAVYSQLYGTKHPVDFLERNTEYNIEGTRLNPWTQSILETEARRVRYSNEIKQGSTIFAEHRAQHSQQDPADDNHFDAWQLTGGRNMAVLTGSGSDGKDAPQGYFDPVMTGGATNQGIVRYLTADAQVDKDGRIVPGDPETLTGSRAPLMTRPELETLRFDPFDRQQMTASTIMQSSEVTAPTGTALMTFGGWTADDPIVVSTEFAGRHQIRGAGGQLRDLVVGDKLSDLHGNKGVVSLIVDRHMDPAEAAEQDLEKEIAWFRENPEMDVVMSPFSLISRRNAGSARELMQDAEYASVRYAEAAATMTNENALMDFADELTGEGFLADPDGTFGDEGTGNGIGRMRFVVTHMAVDEKTKIYDEEAVLSGKGRKASSQLAWALQSQDCPAIMREFYGHNSGAEANLREYLLVTGLDMEADGTLRVVGKGDLVDDRPERRLITMPDLVRTRPSGDQRPSLNTVAMRKSFGDLIGDRGGDMEIPFELTYPTGEPTEKVSDRTWKLPVMSSHLRSGQEFEDGSSVTHDYTRGYQEVFVEACRYRHAQELLEDPATPSVERYAAQRSMVESVGRAQRAFESITTDVTARVLEGKNNIFKNGLMASRLSDSATMVWTADPRLDIDQVALPPRKAEQLGLAEGDHALVWRDPVLRDSGVRYMRVAIDERLTGAAINPVMDKCFDGDFDGDAVAVVKLHTEAAKQEALEKLSVPANLLDKGVVDEHGKHPLAIQVSLDTQVAISKDPFLQESIQKLGEEAHRADAESETGGRREANADLTRRLSDFYRYAQREEFGAALSFGSIESHLRSVREVCVETGAKGSEKKLEEYAKNLGDRSGVSGITKDDQEASMFATAIKSHGTGLGGMYSQRAVRALRGEDLKAVLEVTYPVTQSILQAKHDAAEARHKYEMLQGPGRELWRGRVLEHTGPGQWSAVYQDGEPVQADLETWKAQFEEFYSSKEGFGVSVNPENIARVAEALADPNTGLIRNLEEDESLQGAPLDRMAYGGSFKTLVDMAKKRESIFDGEKNEQFASAGTRKVRQQQRGQLESLETKGLDEAILEQLAVADSVLKRDVVAEHEDLARTRTESRRSRAAVSVGRPASRRPSFETQTEDQDDYGMEL